MPGPVQSKLGRDPFCCFHPRSTSFCQPKPERHRSELIVQPSPIEARSMTALDTATEVVSQSFNPDILLIFSDNATPVSHETHSTSAFPQFKRLPAELRCLIWEYAIPDAALIPRSWNNKRFQYNLQRRVPGVLQACAEARELLAARPDEPETRSSRYSLVQTHGEKTGTGAYVNWKADSIWIHRGCGYPLHASFVEESKRLTSSQMI